MAEKFSDDYQALLTKNQMVGRMSRKGNCYDNAPIESFFGTLKTEWVFPQQYATWAEARLDIFEYIEVFVRHEARYVHGARAPTANRRAVSLSP